MSANRARASEGAVGIALLGVGKGVVFHFVVPGLHVEGRGAIPGEMSEKGFD